MVVVNHIVKIDVTTWVSNLAINKESKNIVKIYQGVKTEESIEDESGIVTLIDSSKSLHEPNSHIHLFPRSCTSSSHLFELLRDEQVPCCGYLDQLHDLSQFLRDEQVTFCRDIGKKVALQVKHSFANDFSLREPVFVTVNVKYIYERRMILPPAVSVPRGAPAEVLQRLVEEQIVESTCSICIENLSGNIIRMPRCLHMFHQDCLFKWLGHQNSCPLCRGVPYKEETQTSA